MTEWTGYDLVKPPKTGLVVMAVSDWHADVAAQAILDAAGVRYSLCSGVYDGVEEDCFIVEWDDWTEHLAEFAREDAQDTVLLVKPTHCFTVNVKSVSGKGFLVVDHLKSLRREQRVPRGNYTTYDDAYYVADPALEKKK